MKIQIIIPVYNAEKFLRPCLDSVRAQTFTEWEAIIIDDGSTDKSREIIEEYHELDPRFTYIFKEENSGVSKTRNLALSKLTGEYTAFIDADDYWESEMLEEMVNKVYEYNCDVVQCRFMYDFANGKKVFPTGAFSDDILLEGKGMKKVYKRMMTGINMNHVCMKLIRTDIIKDLRFDTELKTAEDLKFCVEMFSGVEKYYFINKPMYHYRRSDTSLTGSGLPANEKIKANKAVAKVMKEHLEQWGMDNIFCRSLCTFRHYIIAMSKIYRTIREKI